MIHDIKNIHDSFIYSTKEIFLKIFVKSIDIEILSKGSERVF